MLVLVIAGIALFVIISKLNEAEPEVPSGGYDVLSSIQSSVSKRSMQYGIPTEWLFTTIELESHFDPNQVGDNGKSFGLMQIQEASYQTTLQAGFSTVPNWKNGIDQNILVGCRYATWLRDWYRSHYHEEIDNPTLRELWTLGPGAWSKGLRNKEQREKYIKESKKYGG